MNIKDIVKNNTVRFLRDRQGHAYYGVTVPEQNGEYSFPLPLEDIGDATLEAQDKAIIFNAQVAFQVGFQDPACFSRLFKQTVSVPASAYRTKRP